MKKIKKIVFGVFAVLAVCLLSVNVQTVNAETSPTDGKIYINYGKDGKGNVKEQKKVRITTYSESVSGFSVRYGSGDRIANLKVNKKGLTAKVTDTENDSTHGSSYISLYATKPATYKVTFDVVNSNNVKRGHYTVQVQAVNSTALIKKATFKGKTVLSDTGSIKKGVKTTSSKSAKKVTGSSGKLKLTANSQYKITGIVVAYVNKNGTYSYKKIKNGKTLTLSKNYDYVSISASTGSTYHSDKKYTDIYVSYKDKFFGDTVTYSISSARGRKEIKRVSKDVFRGTTTTTYSRCPIATFYLWQY